MAMFYRHLIITLSLLILGVGAVFGESYPAVDFSPRLRVEGGVKLHSVFDSADVIFPQAGWKYVDTTWPGGGFVIDPTTGVALRFDGVRFGRKYQEFFLWGWSAAEHSWASKFSDTQPSERMQADFLQEWKNRALVEGSIEHPDNLSITYPVLSKNQTAAQLFDLRLNPRSQTIVVKKRNIGLNQFSYIEFQSSCSRDCGVAHLESELWLSYFRSIPRLKVHQFFVATLHLPTSLPEERKQSARAVFEATLETLRVQLLRE